MEHKKKSEELKKCLESPAYFINNYCRIKTKSGKEVPVRKFTDDEVLLVSERIKAISTWGFRRRLRIPSEFQRETSSQAQEKVEQTMGK